MNIHFSMKSSLAWKLLIPMIASCPGTLSADSYPDGVNSYINISGVYPHLTMWNDENECGTGALVPWQGSLWAITYAPHQPGGSTDKLYRIGPDLNQVVYEGSVGGTPANRMIHKETHQALLGPYVIDADQKVRTISPDRMFGRLTGNARSLTDPKRKVYYATMEEGLYEVDLIGLDVKTLIRDGNNGAPEIASVSELPGYHGKGLYSGQGRLVYANNGERHPDVSRDPTIASGALAEWSGSGDWNLVRRNQFTEVTGPGGIYGSSQPDKDPIWTLGWDAKSLLLGLLENGEWSFYRLPKSSHSYDGSHGWNTEWPRIREIGETDLLATMHGAFWRFPAGFSKQNSAGILPRSNYLKVIGDFCRWGNQVVLGCDDSARAEFLNTRSFKASQGSPKQSNSNLWFVDPDRLDHLGPVIGRGSVWLRDSVSSGQISDPYLLSGYDYRWVHLHHRSDHSMTFVFEIDQNGNDTWETFTKITVPPHGAISYPIDPEKTGAWIRVKATEAGREVTVHFQYRNKDLRSNSNDCEFTGLATVDAPATRLALMRSISHDRLGIVATQSDGSVAGYYEMNPKMEIIPKELPGSIEQWAADVIQPEKAFLTDSASVLIVEDGKRYRLPKNDSYTEEKISTQTHQSTQTLESFLHENLASGRSRVCREVATERDLLNIHGTFYELPARNAQGLAKIRPVATHNLAIHDFCSHNGLLLISGLASNANSERIFKSADGNAQVWAGVVDDLWKLGKPRGFGGPWKDSTVKANEPSDPYLMTAYDKKKVTLKSSAGGVLALEVDIDGTGLWIPYQSFQMQPGKEEQSEFPEGFSAYWVRAISSIDTEATVQFEYD